MIKRCGPCAGTGYYEYRADTCQVCQGLGEIEVEGDLQDYRHCGPCAGTGYYTFRKDTCKICGGTGILGKGVARKFVPANAPELGSDMLPDSLVTSTRGYIEKVVEQVNGCYHAGHYDACLVMARRLLETLIIEVFEHHKIDSKIKNKHGHFYHLRELVQLTAAESTWNIGRKTKSLLPQLKDLGDRSAHERRFNAHQHHVDTVASDLAIVVQELVSLAGLK